MALTNSTPAALRSGTSNRVSPLAFIIDVDGVMTDGSMLYSADGKAMKRFGPDDHDALVLMRQLLPIQFVSGDSKGFAITSRRIVTDMQFPLELVSTVRRREWIATRYPLDQVVYMGDGIFDALVLQHVGYGIAPADASPLARRAADFVTESAGGCRAVAEACLHLMERFYAPINLEDVYKAAGQERVGT